jgi:hypothetical protein
LGQNNPGIGKFWGIFSNLSKRALMEAIRVKEVLLEYYVVDPSTPREIHSGSKDNVPLMTEVHESVDIPFQLFWNA